MSFQAQEQIANETIVSATAQPLTENNGQEQPIRQPQQMIHQNQIAQFNPTIPPPSVVQGTQASMAQFTQPIQQYLPVAPVQQNAGSQTYMIQVTFSMSEYSSKFYF